jgi:hypothetical protein
MHPEMDPSNRPYVKHPTIAAELLHGKVLAKCKGGLVMDWILYVEDIQPDGSYHLQEQCYTRRPANAEGIIQGERFVGWLDQATVDRIEAVEGDCPLRRMEYEFALFEDTKSDCLKTPFP